LNGALISDNYIIMEFSGKDVFRESDQPLKATKNGQELESEIFEMDNNRSIKKIKLSKICFASDCDKDSSHTIIIENLKNAPYKRSS
jgi:hypothetical protein